MKTLIFGTMYLKNEKDCMFVNAWYECWKRYNSQYDFLLIDSNSNEKWLKSLNISTPRKIFEYDDIFTFSISKKENLVSFINNVGHLDYNGHDGWGRAFCTGVANAIFNNYHYAVHIESDLLFKGDVSEIIREMYENYYYAVSTKSWLLNWLETGLIFMDVNYLDHIQFISKYNWKCLKKGNSPELIIPSILGGNLDIVYKYWYGDRNDTKHIHLKDIERCIYLTHCSEEEIQLFMAS